MAADGRWFALGLFSFFFDFFLRFLRFFLARLFQQSLTLASVVFSWLLRQRLSRFLRGLLWFCWRGLWSHWAHDGDNFFASNRIAPTCSLWSIRPFFDSTTWARVHMYSWPSRPWRHGHIGPDCLGVSVAVAVASILFVFGLLC